MDYLLYNEDPIMTSTAASGTKRPHSLDLDSPGGKQAKLGLGGFNLQQAQALLASPDFQMLKLTSPELEKMLITSTGMVTTPTPGQFTKPATEEQDQFAKGFLEALNNLHKQNAQAVVPVQAVAPKQPADAVVPEGELHTVTSLPGSVTDTATVDGTSLYASSVANGERLLLTYPSGVAQVVVKQEDPQTVPQMSASPDICAVGGAVNLEEQEHMKLERKRARNREAARRCRNRKLNRIATLEERVKELKGQNSELGENASKLREEVCKLKQQIMQHIKSGCQIMVAPNMKLGQNC